MRTLSPRIAFVRLYMRAFRAAEVLAGVSVMRSIKIVGMFAFSFMDGYDSRRSWDSRILLRKYSFG